MTRNRLIGTWMQPVAGLLTLAALLGLGGCGGGSGAPNNPYAPGPATVPALTVAPPSATLYSGTPSTLTISGGTPPYRAFSSNSAVLPVAQAVAANTVLLVPNPISADADVPVAVTIKDSGTQTVAAAVTVKAALLLGTLAVQPASTDCGTSICSGDTGKATVTARLPSGGPAADVLIRFDVIYGSYAISTSNPATPLASTLTVVTDSTGTATVGLQAQASASTQPAQIRATAVAGGQQLTGNFTIANRSVSTEVRVVPDTATIQSTYSDECSTGFRIDYFVYGGNPPYRVSASFPAAVSILNPTVFASGGFFEAFTTGVCVDPLTFTIVDASGKQTTASLANRPGSLTRPGPANAPDLQISPTTIDGVSCVGKTFQFTLVGGTPPYNVVSSVPGTVLTPAVVNSSGGTTKVSNVTNDSGLVTLTVVDSSLPKKLATATIDCAAGTSNTTPLLVTPGAISSLSCTGTTFQFTASGGTPPYAVASSTVGVNVSPASIPASGGSTSVSGLANGSGTTTFSFRDSSSPQQSVTTTVSCTPEPQPLMVTPDEILSRTSCSNQTFQLTVTGGTPPYTLFPSIVGPLFSPPTPAARQGTIAVSGGTSAITNLTDEVRETTITVVDSNNPQFSTSARITCNANGTPLTVTPGDYGSSQLPRACVGQTFTWDVAGGTPPYDARFSPTPAGGGVITRTLPGQFVVTGLTLTGTKQVDVIIADSAQPNNVQTRRIWCQ